MKIKSLMEKEGNHFAKIIRYGLDLPVALPGGRPLFMEIMDTKTKPA